MEEKEISTNLTISDIKILNNVIEMVASKGLIRASDYTLLGGIYDKIQAILNQLDDSAQK